jgi:hypothetical protein
MLVSASCTTGWLDWVHGELWLLPDGLLRPSLDWAASKQHGAKRTVSDVPTTRSFDDAEITKLVARNSRNVWVAADQIGSARLRVGATTSRLGLSLADGRTIKLLWLRADQAHVALRDALLSWGVQL